MQSSEPAINEAEIDLGHKSIKLRTKYENILVNNSFLYVLL